jgi:hypothetical protein
MHLELRLWLGGGELKVGPHKNIKYYYFGSRRFRIHDANNNSIFLKRLTVSIWPYHLMITLT